MKKYTFYLDETVIMTERSSFSLYADSEEDAIRQAKKYMSGKKTIYKPDNYTEVHYIEPLDDTRTVLSVEENGNKPTSVLYMGDHKKFICDNSKTDGI